MNKGITAVLIILLSLVIIGLTTGLILVLNGKMNLNFSSPIHIGSNYCTKLVEEKEIESIKDLDLSGNSVDIKVEESDTNTIKIELYSDNVKRHLIEEEDNVIKVVLEEKKSVKMFNFKTPYIKVLIPSSYNKKIKANLDVGDIRIGSFKEATLNAKTNVGDIKVESVSKANIETRTGDIKVENTKDLTGNTKTGDIKVTNVNNIYSKTNVGDIKVINVSNYMDLSTKTGDVKVEKATIKKDSKVESNVGDVKIKNVTGCYVEGSTKVGDTDINNKDRKSDIILKIKTRVGDIEVND